MSGEKNDRRVRRTKALLRQSLTGLLAEKPIQEITVKELSERADVNRGTFYCHYQDIYDMVEQLENEIFAEFTALIDGYSADKLRGGLRPILCDIFQFIARNADLCTVLLGRGGDSRFFQRIKGEVDGKVLREWGTLYGLGRSPNRDYTMNYLVTGFVGLLQTWVEHGLPESPEAMAALAEALILYGIHPLQRG